MTWNNITAEFPLSFAYLPTEYWRQHDRCFHLGYDSISSHWHFSCKKRNNNKMTETKKSVCINTNERTLTFYFFNWLVWQYQISYLKKCISKCLYVYHVENEIHCWVKGQHKMCKTYKIIDVSSVEWTTGRNVVFGATQCTNKLIRIRYHRKTLAENKHDNQAHKYLCLLKYVISWN